ncbi:hypothetical protein PGQ11_008965 [Apiospora arundinis]|uniref:T6SS Phospholipase effector Tle1-like catalytic domain-containing protein n=1 Tax=Apiospora arundinis TaxID=335852 RepID=A0ABR2IHR2_9PEZI
MPSRARSKSVESGRSRNAADAASPRGRHAAFYAERDENHDNIEHELSSQTRNLRRLINVKQLMPLPSGQYDSAGAFMNSVGENCEKKRIFICCDGTGNNASGTVDPLTNVAKLARAVDRIGEDEYNIPEKEQVARNRSPDGQDAILDDADEARRFGSVRQIVYYSSGVGTRSVLGSDSLYASAFGKGLSANLLDAYCFICNNYNGRSVLDEIILAGFSRGAFTVRCLARFIKDVGLLRRSGLAFLKTVYKFWKDNAGYEPDEWLSEGDWPENYRNLRNTMDVLRKEGFITGPHSGVRIKVLAEWDTVSAMGLFTNPLSFVGNKVPKNVENAFLAVSLHEKRKKFKPMLWDSKENEYTNVKQCIFAGCHSDIGGGNPDPALSGASFFWMLAQIKDCGCKAAFSHNTSTFQYVIPIQLNRGLRFWKRPIFRLHIQSFAEGRVQESRRGAYAIPYWLSLTLWDGKRDALWDTFLKQHTKEHPIGLTTHITVRLLYERRYRQPAVEKADKGLRCGFFKHFKPEEISPDLTGWRWIKRGTKEKPFLKEDDMGESEKKLFESLLHQAQGIHRINSDEYWRRNNTLRDEENDCNWTRINDELMKGPIFKGCTYENTFVSLLGHTLGDTSGNADDVSGPAGVSADSVGSIHIIKTIKMAEMI